ncbi:hypothetical protein PCE1_001340 [Barthelona sp. PCE]
MTSEHEQDSFEQTFEDEDRILGVFDAPMDPNEVDFFTCRFGGPLVLPVNVKYEIPHCLRCSAPLVVLFQSYAPVFVEGGLIPRSVALFCCNNKDCEHAAHSFRAASFIGHFSDVVVETAASNEKGEWDNSWSDEEGGWSEEENVFASVGVVSEEVQPDVPSITHAFPGMLPCYELDVASTVEIAELIGQQEREKNDAKVQEAKEEESEVTASSEGQASEAQIEQMLKEAKEVEYSDWVTLFSMCSDAVFHYYIGGEPVYFSPSSVKKSIPNTLTFEYQVFSSFLAFSAVIDLNVASQLDNLLTVAVYTDAQQASEGAHEEVVVLELDDNSTLNSLNLAE